MANMSNCSYLSEAELDRLSLARGVAGIAACVGSSFTLLIISLYRAYKNTLQRLFLYLPVALTVHLVVNIMQIDSNNERYCEAVGFLNQYTLHVVIIFLFGAVVYLSHRVRKSSPNRRKETKPNETKTKRNIFEIVFVIAAILSPLTYNWIPFVTDTYGGRPWCWLMLYTKKGCLMDTSMFLTILFVGFLPLIIMLFLSTMMVLSIVITYAWWAYRFREAKLVNSKLKRRALAPLLLIVILVLYSVYSSIFMTAGIILYAQDDDSFNLPYGLLMVNAVFLPLAQLALPVSFVVYLYSFKREVRKAKKAVVSYFKTFSVTKEESRSVGTIEKHEPEETFVKSVPIDVPSTTFFPLPHEFSDEFVSSPPAVSPGATRSPPAVGNSRSVTTL